MRPNHSASQDSEKSAKEKAEEEKQRQMAEAGVKPRFAVQRARHACRETATSHRVRARERVCIAAAKREENIKKKEEERAEKAAADAGKPKKASSKYSKADVLQLHSVFKDYDKDNSGKISLEEFTALLKKKKEESKPKPGQKSTLDERKASEGVSILDLSEGAFHEMDTDGDGGVTFLEILKLVFHKASKAEFETMQSWVAAEPEPEPEPEPELSETARKEILKIFKLYDKDKSGTLTKAELTKALINTGLEKDEIEKLFKEYDGDGSTEIDKDEFLKLMHSTGAFDGA